jgi:histone H3/H4
VATKPLKGNPHKKSAWTIETFSFKNGIMQLLKELGPEDVQISSRALIVVNGLAKDLLIKFTRLFKEEPLSGKTMTKEVVRLAAKTIIKDDAILRLSDANVETCCKYKFPSDGERMYKSDTNREHSILKFSESEIRWFVAKRVDAKYRMGAGLKSLTTRVQHIIGELLGGAIEICQAAKRLRVSVQDLQKVLRNDPALDAIFRTPGSTQSVAESIGMGMPENIVSTKRGAPSDAKFEDYNVDPDLWACVNPYSRTKSTKTERSNACTQGGRPLNGFGTAYPHQQSCTAACRM